LAEKIRAERAEHSQERREQSELEKQVEHIEKQLDEYNNGSFLNKTKDYFKMRAVKESLGMAQAQKTEIEASIASRDPNRSGQDAIDTFYAKEKQRWVRTEYSKEDIKKLFTEEHLASLSVEDYALLMKRFPSEMVTHVTRQGVRDHTGMWEHTAGEGAFHNGFEKMLDDGALKSPLAIKFAENGKEETILEILRSKRSGELPKTREEALNVLDSYMRGGQGSYADKAAVHFAAEEVADHYYGSEKGNEIFIAYPSAFVGSQYHFSHGDIAPEKIGDQHNDAWVLSQEDHGMKLDAGLVFIPKDAQVDPKTGSRYEIGPDKKPLKNTAAVESLKQLTDSPKMPAYMQQIQERLGRLSTSEKLPSPSTWESELGNSNWDSYARKDVLEALLPIRDKIKEITGISDDRILSKLFDYRNAGNFGNAGNRHDERERQGNYERAIDSVLEESGTRFAEAKNTVSSEEYWSAYFSAHPDKKPSKIIFYSGGDPTKAMYEWKRAHGIDKRSADTSAGFVERKAMTAGEEVGAIRERADRFENLVRAIIEEKFPENQSVETMSESQSVETLDDEEELPPPFPPEDASIRRPPPPPMQ